MSQSFPWISPDSSMRRCDCLFFVFFQTFLLNRPQKMLQFHLRHRIGLSEIEISQFSVQHTLDHEFWVPHCLVNIQKQNYFHHQGTRLAWVTKIALFSRFLILIERNSEIWIPSKCIFPCSLARILIFLKAQSKDCNFPSSTLISFGFE